MLKTEGRRHISALAEEFAIDVRSVRRDVLAATGLSPLAFSAILQGHRALAQLQDGQTSAVVAVASGYADQLHMTRAIRKLTGLTPTLAAKTERLTVPGPVVRFLQDSTASASL